MLIYKTYKFRMYPDLDQVQKLNSFLGTKRFIYNYYLNEKEKNKNLTFNQMKQDLVFLKDKHHWLKEVDDYILLNALDDLENAYKRFYNKLSGKPKHKSYNSIQTYRTSCKKDKKGITNIKVDLENNVIKLPKLDEIKIKGYRKLKEFNLKIINATVLKEAGKYYVLVLVLENLKTEPLKMPKSIVGVDLGVKDIITTSNGLKIHKIDELKKLENKLKGLNKWLSRSKLGSKNHYKIILKIEKINQKIKNIRKTYNHLITTNLIKENDIIVIENLKINPMIIDAKDKIAKYLYNTSLNEIIHNLRYKATWYNKKIYQVSTYYPSSQLCSNCKSKNSTVKDLSVRKWECPRCHFVHDRDMNASLNILDEGLKLYLKDLQKFN